MFGVLLLGIAMFNTVAARTLANISAKTDRGSSWITEGHFLGTAPIPQPPSALLRIVDSGCDPLPPPSPSPWIALATSEGCSLHHKVENAARMNATGILILVERDSLDDAQISLRFPHECTDARKDFVGEPINRAVFNCEFSLSFHAPRKDTCHKCDALNLEIKVALGDEAAALKIKHELHLRKAEKARESLKSDTIKTKENNNISAVLIYEWREADLLKLLKEGSEIIVHISFANCCFNPHSKLNRTSTLVVSVSFIFLMTVTLLWLVFYYVQRFRYADTMENFSRKLGSAARKALSQIPVKHVKVEDKELQEGECCAICIELYKSAEVIRILPCGHGFHKSCIDPWLVEHRTCPMCKLDILRHYGLTFTGSEESILQMDMEETNSVLESLEDEPGSSQTIVINVEFSDGDEREEMSRGSSPDPTTTPATSSNNGSLEE